MSLRRAQAEIDSAEFTLWMAEYAIEPWGDEREDRRAAAQIAASVAAAGGKMEWAAVMELVNPWAQTSAGTPSRKEVADKIRLFNAGLRGNRGK